MFDHFVGLALKGLSHSFQGWNYLLFWKTPRRNKHFRNWRQYTTSGTCLFTIKMKFLFSNTILSYFVTAPSIADFEEVNVSRDCSTLLCDAMISACDFLKVLAHFKCYNYSLLCILKAYISIQWKSLIVQSLPVWHLTFSIKRILDNNIRLISE